MIRALSLFKEKVDNMNRVDQFMALKNLYEGARYKLGKENLEETDCSGLICGILTFMGNKIRINADNIKNILTIEDNSMYDEAKVKLMFFLDKEGVAKHVGIICPNGLLFHSSSPNGARYEALRVVNRRYEDRGLTPYTAMLDFSKVDMNTGLVYDLDEELS